MADYDGNEQFENIQTPGVGGLHTIVDPQDIDDTEMADCENVIFTGGYVQPRQGSKQLFAKPTNETNAPNTLARGSSSDGIDYLIAIYGKNFYLYDPLNKQTILLNQGGVGFQSPPGPTGYQKFWSYDTWLGGIGTDVMYFADGIDNPVKWQMALSYPAMAAASSDLQILMPYPNRFVAAGGDIIAVLAGVPTLLTYTVINNVLTITTSASVTSFSIASSNAAQLIANPASNTYTITFAAIPSNNDTFTFTINGTGVVATAVNSIGSNPGNFLIGSLTASFENLLGLLSLPGTTSTTQIAFSAPNQNLIDFLTVNSFQYNSIYFNGSAIGTAIPLTTAITAPIFQTSNVPICSIVKSIQQRLWAIGGKGTESRISWSETSTPENFSDFSDTNADPGTTVWGEGNGGINAIIDGGGFIYFVKANLFAQGQFLYSSDQTVYLFSLVDFASGTDVGVGNFKRMIKTETNIDYLTNINGITELSNIIQPQSGTSTAESTGASFSILSEKINDKLQQPTAIYSFDNVVAMYYAQKSFWAMSSTVGGPNDTVLLYDYLYEYWSIFKGWFVQDMVDYNNPTARGTLSLPYFLSNADGSVNQFLTGSDDNGFAYKASWSTKRFDFGDPAMPKSIDKVFVQGYIDNVTNLEIDVLFNEDGFLWKSSYNLNGDSIYVLRGNPSGTIGADTIGSIEIGGTDGEAGSGTPVPFRVYLDCSASYLFHNVQLVFSTNQTAATWRVDKIGFNPRKENGIPTPLLLGPVSIGPSGGDGFDLGGFDEQAFDI